ncbi:AsnC family transcriptional regulator, partial [Dehalococcoidia bacterium]|nr:AsnC family transcriptional regulator [Dehalococcoidia bacterium]
MDQIDRKLLNAIQNGFPLTEEPYKELGNDLEITETEVMERLGELKAQNVVRQISAIFDTRRLGYKTTLVAFAYKPEQLNTGALFINRHPGVSHNYAREGSYYNLWFTLAVPGDGDLDQTIKWMAEETNAVSYRIMPTIRFFKIGVNFDMVKQKSDAHNYNPDGGNPDAGNNGSPTPAWNQAVELSEFDKSIIRELQEDLPLESKPFNPIAERLGTTTSKLFQLASEFQERKLMRRYSAVLHHRRSGFRSNAMIVWKVPPERSEEVGMIMAENSAVTHCYERPTFPDWPYTHFTMVHATTEEGCEVIAEEISKSTGITENQLLYSTREYKKTRVRYFVEDYEEFWETETASAVTQSYGKEIQRAFSLDFSAKLVLHPPGSQRSKLGHN